MLINRNFTRLWAGQAVSQVGDFVFDTTLVLWVSTVLLQGKPYVAAAVAAVPLCVAVPTLLAGPLAGVFVFFVTENLRVSARFYGTLDMGLGIGLIAGSLATGFVAARLGSARLFWVGLLVVGIGLGVYARLTDLVAAVVVLGLIGVPLAALNAAVGPLMLRTVPHEYVGRVGRIDTIFVVCAVLIVAGAMYAAVALRGADQAATSAQAVPIR